MGGEVEFFEKILTLVLHDGGVIAILFYQNWTQKHTIISMNEKSEKQHIETSKNVEKMIEVIAKNNFLIEKFLNQK